MTPHRSLVLLSRALFVAMSVALGLAGERQPWTTSRIHGSPEPPKPFRVERVYPNITFVNPLDAGTIPGTHRLGIVEQRGKISSVEDESAKEADLFADLKQYDKEVVETYGVTFHPKFAQNRQVFIWVNLDAHGK